MAASLWSLCCCFCDIAQLKVGGSGCLGEPAEEGEQEPRLVGSRTTQGTAGGTGEDGAGSGCVCL